MDFSLARLSRNFPERARGRERALDARRVDIEVRHQPHARRGQHDVLEVGFAAPRAHHIVAIDACPILSDGLAGAIPAAWAIAEVLKPTRKPLDIQVTATDSGLDVDVRGSGPLSAATMAALAGIADLGSQSRFDVHVHIFEGDGPGEITCFDLRFDLGQGLPPLIFFSQLGIYFSQAPGDFVCIDGLFFGDFLFYKIKDFAKKGTRPFLPAK